MGLLYIELLSGVREITNEVRLFKKKGMKEYKKKYIREKKERGKKEGKSSDYVEVSIFLLVYSENVNSYLAYTMSTSYKITDVKIN